VPVTNALYPSEDLYPSEELYPSDGFEHPIAVLREHPPDRMAIRVSDPKSGRTIARLAEDEADLANVISAIGYESEMQGGSKSLKGNLGRDPRVPWSDLPAYADVTVYSDGVEELWWGRVEKLQGAEGDRTGLDLEAVGHIAALEDDKACLGLGFIDADQTKWGEPSVERRKQLIEANIALAASTSLGFGSLEDEKEPPGILNDFASVTTLEGKDEAGEADYDSGGVDIDGVLYDYRQLSSNGEDANWESNLALGTTDTFTTAVAGSDHNRTTALQQAVSASGQSGYRFARLRDRFTSSAGGGEMNDLTAWQNLRVLSLLATGNGLGLQGTWPNVGYTAKQMLACAVPTYSYLEARDEDLEDDGFVIPHAWFSDPGDLATVVKELTKFGLLDWFIYGGKRLQLRYPGTYGRFWQAAPGTAELKETGLDANRLWREIVVAFQDVDGTTKYVGPPGSGAHIEHASLEVTDPDHPAVRAEITRKDLLVMKGVGDVPTAIKIGMNWLVEGNELSHAGECALSDYVMSDKGIWYPSSHVKAGDYVRFPGRDSTYRKMTHADYQRSERKASCSLDAPPGGLDALQERFQVELKSWGITA
jgi:hypothetical protein